MPVAVGEEQTQRDGEHRHALGADEPVGDPQVRTERRERGRDDTEPRASDLATRETDEHDGAGTEHGRPEHVGEHAVEPEDRWHGQVQHVQRRMIARRGRVMRRRIGGDEPLAVGKQVGTGVVEERIAAEDVVPVPTEDVYDPDREPDRRHRGQHPPEPRSGLNLRRSLRQLHAVRARPVPLPHGACLPQPHRAQSWCAARSAAIAGTLSGGRRGTRRRCGTRSS